MRETDTLEIPTLAADEALAYVREVESLGAEIDTLLRGDLEDSRIRKALSRARQRLGIALKLADVHASLAVAEQITGLRADLAEVPPSPIMGVAEAVGVVRPFTGGNVHHCSPYCPTPCPNAQIGGE